MKLLFDMFPVILFFATYKFVGHEGQHAGACLSMTDAVPLPLWQEPILMATAVAIIATFLQVGWLLLRRKKVDTMLWLSFFIVASFGGATLYFRNPTFIQWKPTVLYWCFAAAILFSEWPLKRNLVRGMMESQIKLPDPIWKRLSGVWVVFMFGLGVANLVAMKLLSCDDWVNFKFYGITSLMFLFMVAQALLLSRHMIVDDVTETP